MSTTPIEVAVQPPYPVHVGPRVLERLDELCAPFTACAVLADERVDVVNLSGPNHVHAEQGIAAAEAGKHILIEKPMVLSIEENRALRDQQANLIAERASLIEKSELARTRVEAMIGRLKAMEQGT